MSEATPSVRRVRWRDARRIVSARHPPIDLFEDIADPDDWGLLLSAEAKTNPRLAASVGRLDLVPPERRVSGTGASWVMASFTHVSPDRSGRFHDGHFGAYYAARLFRTAVAETTYHRVRFFRATGQAPGWFSQYRELVGSVDHRFHDLRRGDPRWVRYLDPDDYGPSQAFARRLRAAGSNGLVFPSVRDPGGSCLAAFWPDVVGLPKPGRLLAYHFDGEAIDLVRDESSRELLRILP